MRSRRSIRILLLVAALATAAVAAAADVPRNILWAALQGCIVAKRTTGRAFPCLSVDLGTPDRPGTAILRAPGQRTHLVVMPTADVIGLEAPVLQGPAGVAYWRAALAARRDVTEVFGDRLPGAEVGLAVNSPTGRSQDQLHIHVDCVRPQTRALLRRYARSLPAGWVVLPTTIQGGRLAAMRVPAAAVDDFNPFAALAAAPGAAAGLRHTTFAAISAPPDDPAGGFYLLLVRQPYAAAEKLLDHRCTILDGGEAR
ncbi:CDP-diacylglycerol diphosphatase [Methylobacterium sp. JK268]